MKEKEKVQIISERYREENILDRKEHSIITFAVKKQPFIKNRLQHRCFPVNIKKFLRTVFLQNTSGGCFCT